MKVLCWEGDGFGIYHKKLEKGTFELPDSSSDGTGIPITHSQLMLILQGITLGKVHTGRDLIKDMLLLRFDLHFC
jgi:transposase